jgi:hypothetical protein
MQYFGQRRIHARALTGGENHDIEFAVGHNRFVLMSGRINSNGFSGTVCELRRICRSRRRLRCPVFSYLFNIRDMLNRAKKRQPQAAFVIING